MDVSFWITPLNLAIAPLPTPSPSQEGNNLCQYKISCPRENGYYSNHSSPSSSSSSSSNSSSALMTLSNPSISMSSVNLTESFDLSIFFLISSSSGVSSFLA